MHSFFFFFKELGIFRVKNMSGDIPKIFFGLKLLLRYFTLVPALPLQVKSGQL